MNRSLAVWVGAGLAVFLTASIRPAWAVDSRWTNTAGGTFGTAGNWDPSGPPTTTNDTATFGLGGSYEVDFGAAATSGRLLLTNSNAVTFDMAGNTYNVGNGATAPFVITNTASLIVSSSGGGGTLSINGGGAANFAIVLRSGTSLTIDDSLGSPVTVNSQAGADVAGMFTVEGPGTRYNNNVPGVFWTLRNGSTFQVLNGATGTVQNFNVELTGAAVTTTRVDGASTVLNALGLARVIPDAGLVEITGGATWNSGSTFEMGVFFSTGGKVIVGDGIGISTLTAPTILFGTTTDPGRSFPEMIINPGGWTRATSASTNAYFIYDRATATLAGGSLSLTNGAGLQIADINNDNNQEGVLRGFGTINRLGTTGKFTIYNNGDLRPGDTNATPRIGTLSVFDGDLVQYSGGTAHFQFDAGNLADLISMSNGVATLSGTNVFSTIAGFTPGLLDYNTWEFLRADQILYNASDNIDALMAGFGFAPEGYFFGVIRDGNQDVLILQIPEPSTLALIVAAGAFWLSRKRRHG